MVVVRSVRTGHFDRSRQRGAQLRQQLLDAVHYGDDVRAGLPLDVHDHGGRLVHPGGLPDVLRAIDTRSATSERTTGAPLR